MAKLGYLPNKSVKVKDDLLYRYHKLWNLGTRINDESPTGLINTIIQENVGVELAAFKIDPVQFNDLSVCLQVLINNKKFAKELFVDQVRKHGREEESGKIVGEMMKKAIKKLIPGDLVGGQKNKSRFISTILKTFSFGTRDALPIKMFTNGIKFKRIQWFKDIENASYIFRTNFMAKMLLWLWRICKRLVATQYYITEKQGSYNKLIFIYKNVWQKKTDIAFKSLLSSGCLRLIDPEYAKLFVARRNQAKLRWIPKVKGLRPIISVRNDKQQKEIMYAKALLNCLLRKTVHDFKRKLLHEKWKEVVNFLKNNNEIPQLYFVTVDIKDAYGSIIQKKLIEILKETSFSCLGTTPIVHFDSLSGYGGRKKITCRELHDGPYYHIYKSEPVKVLSLLLRIESAIKNQTVKWSNSSYLITKGISQAVSLSPSLCKLYLSHLDRTHLSEFMSEKGDVLLRAVDDYLYITPEKSRAESFLARMSQGYDDYGIFINAAKTQSNLSVNSEIIYYGFSFNTETLEVSVKYPDSGCVSFRNLMTFTDWEEKSTERYTILKNKMKRLLFTKLNKLTTDPDYITARGLARNVFDTACLMACCFKTTVSVVYRNNDLARLMDVVNYCAAIVRSEINRLNKSPSLMKNEILWIVIKAFRMCVEQDSSLETKLTFLLPYLQHREDEVKKLIRSSILRSVYDVVARLPLHFRNGH